MAIVIILPDVISTSVITYLNPVAVAVSGLGHDFTACELVLTVTLLLTGIPLLAEEVYTAVLSIFESIVIG